MKTIRLKFTTDADKPYGVSLNYADPALKNDEGKVLIKKAAEAIMKHQPFGVTLARFNGAELIDRTVDELL